MSDARGEVIHQSKVVGHFQYSGTSDLTGTNAHAGNRRLT